MDYTLNLNIEKLVLEGFPAHQRNEISSAIQDGLTQIFREQGIPESLKTGRKINQINPPQIDVKANQKPGNIGYQVAQSIYSSFNNG